MMSECVMNQEIAELEEKINKLENELAMESHNVDLLTTTMVKFTDAIDQITKIEKKVARSINPNCVTIIGIITVGLLIYLKV